MHKVFGIKEYVTYSDREKEANEKDVFNIQK